MKNRIRINESQLIQIVKNSVKMVLAENTDLKGKEELTDERVMECLSFLRYEMDDCEYRSLYKNTPEERKYWKKIYKQIKKKYNWYLNIARERGLVSLKKTIKK